MMPTPRALRAKVKQTRLAFSPLPSSSPLKDNYSSAVQDRLANVRHSGSRNGNNMISSPPEPEIKIEALPTPQPSSQLKPEGEQFAAESSSNIKPIPSQSSSEGDEEDLDDIALPSSKRRRITRDRCTEEQPTPTRKSTRLATRSIPAQQNSSNPKDKFSIDAAKSSSPAISDSELGEPETTGDEDDAIVTKPIQRRKINSQKTEPTYRNTTQNDDWLVADDEIEYISSDTEASARSDRKARKKRRRDRRRSRYEQEELEDDLADLRDSDAPEEEEFDGSSEGVIGKTPRTRGGPVNTQRDKTREHFELLKRRRAGEKPPRVLESEDEEEPEPIDIDEIAKGRIIGASYMIADDDSSSADQEPDDAEPEDDDFVVDDVPSRRLGLPHPDIPLEFTSYASAKPKDLFIHVIEWLVKNRIAPAFSRDDPIYTLALSKVSDQVTAQAGSRLISAAWNADFKNAILARPEMKMTYLEEFDDDEDGIRTCDACNRTNHPARYDFVLSGEAYKKRDLEPVDEDSDEEQDPNKQEHDEAGHVLPSQDTHFYLGRFCAANARMGHKLTHWKYNLNQNLLGYLEEQGVLSAQSTLARDKLGRKRREREAEGIVDTMSDTGIIASLWKDFQADLDDARLGMDE